MGRRACAGRTGTKPRNRHRTRFRLIVIASCASLFGGLGVAAGGPALASPDSTSAANAANAANAVKGDSTATACHLGNGVNHIVDITFDNVHFFRDNPNVPSDLELMPNLLNFIEGNGTLLSNNHTPLIAHTADDLLTTATGLYGDRQGMPISNSYQAYNSDGTTDPAGSFAYWTDPIYDTATTPNAGHDISPSMVYAKVPPATAKTTVTPTTTTPAPWTSFTRAGCDVGQVGTANTVLENTAVDIPKVFGTGSAETRQLAADTDPYKDAESADYVGVGVHCARAEGAQTTGGSTVCSTATGVKYGQTTATATAVADTLPDEPGGYTGYQALFGHRYVAPQLGAGTASVTRDGYQVTNAAGNLVDLNGNQINGAFLTNHAGFPGFGDINPAQSLAYMADMLESNIPVAYGYVSDLHGNHHIPGLAACTSAPSALGTGSACYIAQAQYFNAAFGIFFKRLAADGINASNTEFVISPDEGDHVAGANVGRTIQPTPATCDGATVTGATVTPAVACTYPAGSFGELNANVTGLLATEKSDTTKFSLEADSAPEFYVTGNPAADTPSVRTLERDTGRLTASNPYSGNKTETIANYLADPTEEAILHMVNADPARTPTFAMFAKPDYYLYAGSATCSGSCVAQNTAFAYNHGDYAAEIDTNWLGLVGPGVASLGVDGSAANAGPSSAGANSGQVTVPGSGTTGTWVDEADIRPTLMYLTGLKDDYEHDGRVITEVLTQVNHALSGDAVASLGACYKQLNSSVGEFGTDTLIADTAAVNSNSTGDAAFLTTDRVLAGLEQARDALALKIKAELEAAAFSDTPVYGARGQTFACQALISAAAHLAHAS